MMSEWKAARDARELAHLSTIEGAESELSKALALRKERMQPMVSIFKRRRIWYQAERIRSSLQICAYISVLLTNN